MAEPVKAPAPAPGSVTLYDKETNAPVVVDAADAPAHILSGQLNYAPGTKIPVTFNGKASTVDADELGDAFKAGAAPLSSKDYHASEMKAQYGSTGQAAQAFALNAADSASLGLSNAVIGGIGGQDTREYMRGITEANPTAATAGDVAGFVAPIAADVLSAGTLTPALAAAEASRVAARAGGSAVERMAAHAAVRTAEEAAGKGLFRTGVEALTAPTRLVSGVGDLAEGAARAVVGSEAKSGAARFAQNVIAGGARGIGEGGIYGVGQEVGHQYLQDNPELTGETLGTAWWHGAMLGGALGGTLHGVGGLLSKKASALEKTPGIERAMLDEGVPGAAAAARESTVADTAAKTIIGQVDDASTRKTLENAWTNRETAFAKHDDLLDDASRKISKSLNETLEAGHTVDMASFGESKSNQMAKLVPAENLQPARDAALKVWADASKVIEELESQTTKGGAEGSVKRLGKWLKDFAEVPKAEWNNPAELFDKIDDFKRRIGKESGFGKSAFGREEATQQFNALYDRVRLSLEDESTWGAAAVAQKEINTATADMLGTGRKFEGSFTTNYGNIPGGLGAPKPVANTAAVDGFVKGLTKPAGDLNLQMFADYSQKRANYLDAVSRNYALDPAAKAAVKAELAAQKAMTETIEKTSSEVASINQLKRILADEKGHGIHGIIGLAIDAVTKPGLTLARLAELEATKNRALAKIESGLNSVKKALGGSGERKKPGLAPKLPDSPDTYDKRRAAVIAAASKPDDLHAHIQGQAAPMAHSAPDTARAFQTAGLRTVQYLMTELPKPQAKPGSLTPRLDTENWKATDQQQADFNMKFDGATHPTALLDFVANGTITTQHVQAVQATSPAIYADQEQKLRAMLDAQTKPVPAHMEGPIKTFLGMPQMDPGLQRILQSAPPAQNPSSGGRKKPLKMADNTSLNATNLK